MICATTVRVGCKVNLGLRITGIRPNGYHALDSLFLPLSQPSDELDFVPDTSQSTGITVACAAKNIDPAHNTLTKAYAAYAAHTGFAPALHVRLRKGIPHGAGLGGGSADAAAVLCWCNTHAPQPLNREALAVVALRVGADVPFFLYNASARVRGIGEDITLCPSPWQGWHLVLLCPDIHISTPWAYTAWDRRYATSFFSESATHNLTSRSLEAKEECSCATWLTNDFESVVFDEHPQLQKLKEDMFKVGASAAVMSGSGSSLAGLFRQSAHARQAAQTLRQDAQVFVSAL